MNMNGGNIYRPEILNIAKPTDKQAFDLLINTTVPPTIYDEIDGQLRELIKSLHPSRKIKPDEYPELIEKHLNGTPINEYGVWVYYPWSHRLIHLLDEEEFIEVRTNRNRYKITKEEQQRLSEKVIGVVGLSVGQSIALTLAMERVCGELRLADFDTAELSNLNRIRTGVHNLGINKTVIAAREILEIDPFIKVKIFEDGLNEGNLDAFFSDERNIDILVEVCDGLDMKITSRFKARNLKIPVIMDTNDRGMLDVERFDLEPDRPIMHGLAGDLDPVKIKDLTNEEKIPYILKIVGTDSLSTRFKASMMEVEQSVNTWPQLASSVVLGGALTTDVTRRILLDQYHDSGRYYIDLEELVANKATAEKKTGNTGVMKNPYTQLDETQVRNIAQEYLKDKPAKENITEAHLKLIVDAAIAAPSAGNNQPWKLYYDAGQLFVFHDKARSWSWGDYYEMGATMGLGALIENIHLQSAALQLTDIVTMYPMHAAPKLIAVIAFEPKAAAADTAELQLAANLFNRHTNRKLGERKKLPASFYEQLEYISTAIQGVKIHCIEEDNALAELGKIIAVCDKIRLLNQQGHEEFYSEVRWNGEEAAATRDGIELSAVDLTQGEIAGFSVAKDWNAVSLLADWDKGDAFTRLSIKTLKSASAMVLFTVPKFDHKSLADAGRAVERAWIYANTNGVSVHPMLSPVFFFNRQVHGNGEGLTQKINEQLVQMRKKFLSLFSINENDNPAQAEVFLMKLSVAEEIGVQSLRKTPEEIFYRRTNA